jgi:hypothetical protein
MMPASVHGFLEGPVSRFPGPALDRMLSRLTVHGSEAPI